MKEKHMTWIRVIDVDEAEGRLREAYEEVVSSRGEVGNILKVHSVHPQVLTAHLHLYRELMFGRSELSRAERETIAVAVSVVNKCHYWIKHHGEALRALTKDDKLIAALERDPLSAPLADRQHKVVAFALKLTQAAGTVSEDDLASLRYSGLSDTAIHDLAAIVAYFNFVNRLALGLGVELEV
jgi:uncharacterized peroxidase-related enzyme